MAWSGTTHGLIAELGVGTVTHSALQLGLGLAGTLAGIGFLALVAGIGLIWSARGAAYTFEVVSKEQPKERILTS